MPRKAEERSPGRDDVRAAGRAALIVMASGGEGRVASLMGFLQVSAKIYLRCTCHGIRAGADGNRHSPRTAGAESVLIPRGFESADLRKLPLSPRSSPSSRAPAKSSGCSSDARSLGWTFGSLACGFTGSLCRRRAALLGSGRPVLVSALSETCRLFPVASGPHAESVLIPAI